MKRKRARFDKRPKWHPELDAVKESIESALADRDNTRDDLRAFLGEIETYCEATRETLDEDERREARG